MFGPIQVWHFFFGTAPWKVKFPIYIRSCVDIWLLLHANDQYDHCLVYLITLQSVLCVHMCNLCIYVSVCVAINEWGHKCAILEVPQGCGNQRTTWVSVFLFNFVWVRSPFVISWVCLPVYRAFDFSWFACVWLPAHHRSIGVIDVSNITLDFWGDLATGTQVLTFKFFEPFLISSSWVLLQCFSAVNILGAWVKHMLNLMVSEVQN